MVDVIEIRKATEELYEAAGRLAKLLGPIYIEIRKIGGKPLAECGISDLAKVAEFVLKIGGEK